MRSNIFLAILVLAFCAGCGDPTLPEHNLALRLPRGGMLKLVGLGKGAFTMGSPADEVPRMDNEKQHQVTFTKDFWIGQYEVTQEQWKAVMGDNPSAVRGDNLPVTNVSWYDARRFCERLNELYAGKLPDDYRFDLPTEAQWERAARVRLWPSYEYEKYSGGNRSDAVAWTYCNSGDKEFDEFAGFGGTDIVFAKLNLYHCKVHPVGLKKPNAAHIYDLNGNVMEWCLDDYEEDNRNAPAEFVSGKTGAKKNIRGGCYLFPAPYARSAMRDKLSPESRIYFLGFRVALVPIK